MTRFYAFFLLLSFLTLHATQIADSNETYATQVQAQRLELEKKRQEELQKRKLQENIALLLAKLRDVESKLEQEKIWTKSYSSYLTRLEVEKNLKNIEREIKKLKRKRRNKKNKEVIESLVAKQKILTTQLNELQEKGSAPFSELITPPKIEDVPKVANPFEIFSAISFLKTVKQEFENYIQRKVELENLINLLKKELVYYKELFELSKDVSYKKTLLDRKKELEKFQTAFDIMSVTVNVYKKRLDVIETNLNKKIKAQIIKLGHLGIIVLVVFMIFFILKMIIKKYITDNERYYMANKFITFTNFTIIVLIVFFNYIENVSYLVTILGFASAGIAIAMKDWFMSILGWLVIVFGGSIHVGDRIRVDMDGMKYIGDVLDISLLRITILEDITLTSIEHNRRAGRIIFIPNNYVFTRLIANYTHYSLKTVWDGVKITITFDSNHKKAMHLVKEIAKKYSKGYTDITRKQLNKLRHHYSLKNTNVEPRIYSFIKDYGIDVEAWYLTNAYATLTLRSVISTEIIDAFNAEDDITIAYPTQHINIEKSKPQLKSNDGEVV